MPNLLPGDDVLVESQIEGYPKRKGVAKEFDESDGSILVEFENGEELWCEAAEVERVESAPNKVRYIP